jgi:hypothetical protein
MVATDEQLHKLLEDLEAWKEKLPESLRFNGPDTGNTAGMFWPRGVYEYWLRVTRLFRSVVHALRLCEHDLLACIHADLLHLSCPSHILPDGREMDKSRQDHWGCDRLA